MTPIEQAEAALARYESQNASDPFHFPLTDHMYVALRALLAEHKRLLAEMHQRELHHFETEQMLTEAGIDLDAVQSSAPTDQDVPAEHPEPPSDWRERTHKWRGRAVDAESKLARIAGVLDDDERSSVILAVIRGIIYDDKEAD